VKLTASPVSSGLDSRAHLVNANSHGGNTHDCTQRGGAEIEVCVVDHGELSRPDGEEERQAVTERSDSSGAISRAASFWRAILLRANWK